MLPLPCSICFMSPQTVEKARFMRDRKQISGYGSMFFLILTFFKVMEQALNYGNS